MEKIKTELATRKIFTHSFYCDDCGDYIGESHEYEDGYYDELGYYERKYFCDSSHEWINLKKCLCDKCIKKQDTLIKEHLFSLGFKGE